MLRCFAKSGLRSSTKACSETDNAFVVHKEGDRELLPPEMAMQIHRTLVHLLFMCMQIRVRLETQRTTACFATIVKSPDNDNGGKTHPSIY